MNDDPFEEFVNSIDDGERDKVIGHTEAKLPSRFARIRRCNNCGTSFPTNRVAFIFFCPECTAKIYEDMDK